MKNKVVIITGASSGIGEATAYEFAKQQASLVLAARSVDKLNIVKEKCTSYGAQVLVVKCDVSEEADCKNLIEQTLQQFKGIDVLINNAGISMRALFNDCELSVIKTVMDTNFWGSLYCTQFALPHLIKAKGSVVAVSSLAGIVGLPARTGYSASKFALAGFMQSLKIENTKTGLHVGIIYPGYTTSNIRNSALNKNGKAQQESPLNEEKLYPAENVGKEILKMVVKRKRNCILTKQGILLKWLNILWPELVDRATYKVVSKEKNSPF
jgi:short-subunit dehydrogenase